jgi:endonuclease-3 related protein
MFIYQRFFNHFGPRHWWPADSPFEIMVGAILTQNTAWRNVEKAIHNLLNLELMSAEAMAEISFEALAEAIRPSGYFKVKAGRLKALVEFILKHGRGGKKPDVLDWPLSRLRPSLLEVKGVGPETADSIVLYAANQPSFVVDSYTRRILSRHQLALGREPYQDIRSWFMYHLTPDVNLYNQYHALIVAAGHQKCGPKRPSCSSCPLADDPLLDQNILNHLIT